MKTLVLTSIEVMLLDTAMKTAEIKLKEMALNQGDDNAKKILLELTTMVRELNHKINAQPEDFRL